LITGGCGFIGSNVLCFLCEKYPDSVFYNIDKLDYCSSQKNVNNYQNYHFIKGDIKSSDLINYILHNYQIDIIIHFAAQSHVDNSFGNSINFSYDNIIGTHTLLECSRMYNKLTKFIHISTDEVYGEIEENDISIENSILNPTNPYAATKAAAEFLVKSYFTSFKLPTVITRGNNVFGPKQYPEKIIPKFISHILKGEKMPIQGDGSNVRNFIYVDDVSVAIDKILKHGKINEIYNIGTENEYSVMDIARILLKKLKPKAKLEENIEFVTDRNFNDKRYHISNQKLKELGWQETIDFNKGIDLTIKWYQNVDTSHW